MGKAHAAFARAEELSSSYSPEERKGFIEHVFYGWQKASVNALLPDLLKKRIESVSHHNEKVRLLGLYCEAVGVAGFHDDALRTLREADAAPEMYVLLARSYRSGGDIRRAKKVLGAIPQEALDEHPELAEEVRDFWTE